ncbi:MAG: hypothetical protein ACR2PX_24655, partial [Endozoicomonas sp.]|uniref:hypothetical protein n=1 Tax=Endozoicomonas sp. TaxID=1892382 RepID=UPI003D9B1826
RLVSLLCIQGLAFDFLPQLAGFIRMQLPVIVLLSLAYFCPGFPPAAWAATAAMSAYPVAACFMASSIVR